MRFARSVEACCLTCALLFVGCGDDDGGGAGAVGATGGSGGGGGVGATGGSGGSGGTTDASTDGGTDSGRDAATDSAMDDSHINPNPLACKPGHYVGQMSGQYRSIAWSVEDLIPHALSSMDADDGTPGLELWLEPTTTACGPGAEFCPELTVAMGSVRGVMEHNEALDIPFEATISGDLDCATGEFRGRLESGTYTILGSSNAFDGAMTAAYELTGSTLGNGVWSADEMPLIPNCPTCGGEGTWSATFVP